MSNEDRRKTMLSEFLDAPTLPTEKEQLEYDTALEVIRFLEDLNKKYDKLDNDPCNEHRDKKMTKYRNQIYELEAWMESRGTPAPELDATIFDELYIGNPLGKKSILGRQVKKVSSKDQQAEHTAASSPKNFFHLENMVFRICYLGKELAPLPANKPLRKIAERLMQPGIKKVFTTEVEYTEHSDKLQLEPEEAKGGTLGVNNKMSLEDRSRTEEITKKQFTEKKEAEKELELAKAKGVSPEGAKALMENLAPLKTKWDKLEKYVKSYNGRIQDNGSISWGVCMDKSIISKQKDAFSQNLRRGIKQIRENGGEIFAEHLEKYLLPDKYYRPPPEEKEFDVKL